jgi:hypothetical protein
VIDLHRASEGPDRAAHLFDAISHEPWWALACLVLLFVLFELALARVRRWLVARRLRLRAGRASDAEAWAARLLSRAGYQVMGTQVRGSYDLLIDGRPLAIALRADYIVERRGRIFVAEVKSGQLAPSLETAATRRQLLEYRIAFDVDGVLLVDGEEGSIHEVVFVAKSRATQAVSRQVSVAPR